LAEIVSNKVNREQGPNSAQVKEFYKIMKRIGLLALVAIFTAIITASAQAQGTGKIGWIDTGMFDDAKDGIKKYVAAGTALDLEFKPRFTELQGIAAKINTLKDELAKMGSNPAVPVNQQAVAAKQEEAQRLQREGEFKQKELQAAVEKRQEVLLGPIRADIGKAIEEYAKQKGYSAILDWTKLAQAGVLLSFDQTADITKDFITFYNARPTTTATTGTPAPPPTRP
jgi:Skp family chaperone for outer membrane proteins